MFNLKVLIKEVMRFDLSFGMISLNNCYGQLSFDRKDTVSDTHKDPVAFLVMKGRWGLCEGRSLPSHSNYYSIKANTLSHLITEGKQDAGFCVSALW